MKSLTLWFLPMHFPARLIQLRKAQGLTQQGLSDTAELHVNQIRRYEAGTAQPTLDALIRLAKVLHVGLDDLVFSEGDRGPDEDLRLQFEALSSMSQEEKQVAKSVLEAMIMKSQVTGAVAGALARVSPPAAKRKAAKVEESKHTTKRKSA
jgi:transcriptional regulator with XRE-family HTH domain